MEAEQKKSRDSLQSAEESRLQIEELLQFQAAKAEEAAIAGQQEQLHAASAQVEPLGSDVHTSRNAGVKTINQFPRDFHGKFLPLFFLSVASDYVKSKYLNEFIVPHGLMGNDQPDCQP